MTSYSLNRVALAALMALAGTVQAQPAQPSPPPPPSPNDSAAIAEARRLYVEGNEHYEAGRYVLAAERFLKAYELSGKPALLFNLANTYERAGNYDRAAHYLRLYLDGGDVHDPNAVRARLQRLELAKEQQKKADAEKAAAAANQGDEDEPTPAPVDGPAAPAPSRVPYYVAGGGVVVGAAAAIAFGLRARSERSKIDGLCVEQGGGVICPPEADAHLSNERRYALFSDIGIGVAAVSAGSALVYYLVTRGSSTASEPSSAVSIVPSASGDGLGVVAAGRF